MDIRKPLLCAFLVSFTLPGANGQTRGALPSHEIDDQKRLTQLEKEVADLESQVNILKSNVSFQSYLLDHKQNKTDSLELDPASRDFQRLDTDAGFFLISLRSVTPYLTGYKVLLNIGNPSSADFANATVTVKWSKAYDFSHYTPDAYKQWQTARHTQTVQLTTALQAGTWNPVEVDLLPASADDLGDLSFEMEAKNVLLREVPSN